MGNKSLTKNMISNEEFIDTQLRHQRVSSNNDLTYTPLYNNTKSDPITFNIIDNNKLYSVLDLALHIQLEHQNRLQYQTNQGLYTSALFYQCKEKDSLMMKRNSMIVKGKNINLINKRNSLNTISPLYKYKSNQRLGSFINDALIPFDSKGLLSNRDANSSRISSNYNSDGLSNKDEGTMLSLNREERLNSYNTNVPIEEESFKCDKRKLSKANTQWGKRASLKSCITYDANYKHKNVMAYSKQVRDKCLKIIANHKRENGLSTNNKLNEKLTHKRRNTNHNESLMNFLYENLNGNPQYNNKERKEVIMKLKSKTNQRKKDHLKFNSFKLNIKQLSKDVTTSMKWNTHTINYKPIKHYNNTIGHKDFISTYEHLIDIDPHNRTQTIKSIIKQKKMQKHKDNNHCQTQEATDLNKQLISSSLLGLYNDDSECSISFNTNSNNNVFILDEAIDSNSNQLHHFKGISSIPKAKPKRDHFQLHFISKNRI